MKAPRPVTNADFDINRLLGFVAPKSSGDGFGQSLIDEFISTLRFRRMRRAALHWRLPLPDDQRKLMNDPFFQRFADSIVGVTTFGAATCVVLERDWSGWPDPPLYALFAIADGKMWAARDFHHWPDGWTKPSPETEDTAARN